MEKIRQTDKLLTVCFVYKTKIMNKKINNDNLELQLTFENYFVKKT